MKRLLIVTMVLVLSGTFLSAQTMTDYEAVQHLVVSERMYRVSHRNAELAQCYAEDAEINTSWQRGGVGSFVGGAPAEAAAASLPNVNRCNPPLIHLNGDRAFVEYPSTTTRGVMVHGVEAVLTSYMRLLYQVEKRNGEWKITKMTSLNEWDELSPAIPGQDLHINPTDVKDLRISYRWLAYTRKLAGGEVSPDEPGTDRPEDVKRLYTEFNNWLNHITMKDFELKNKETGKMLRGTLYRPESEEKVPLIIASHELGSDGFRPWWVNYANHWVNVGYAVVCFDFSGGGERSRSEGKTTDMSVLTEVSDLEQVFAEAKQWDFVDNKRIFLVGGSQGGGVSTIVAARHPKEVAALVLLYPAFHLPDDLRVRYPDPAKWPESDDRGMITIGRHYIEDMYNYDYQADMRAYSGPVLIVHGNVDQVVPLKGSQEAVGIFPNARLHIIKGAGHVFMTDSQQQEFLQIADEFLLQVIK